MSPLGWAVFWLVFLLIFGPILRAVVLDLAEWWEHVRTPPWERDYKPWTREETQEWLDERE
jgi:hypothetical protein